MTAPAFVHLRVHTAYSLCEGAIKAKDLPGLCKDAGTPAVAITDTNNLFGAFELSQTLAKAGIQPIIGCQLAVALPRDEDVARQPRKVGREETAPVVLLAQDEAGWRRLSYLSSRAFIDVDGGDVPHISLAMLCEASEGLILLTGGAEGPVGRLLRDRRPAAAKQLLQRFAEAYPDRCYVELQRHHVPEEAETEPAFVAMADALGLPLVATNDVYFGKPEMAAAHDALICIGESAYLGESDRRRLTPEHGFKDAQAMAALFADLPDAVANTVEIARRCVFRVEPHAPILPRFPTRQGRTEAQELRVMAEAGLNARFRRHSIPEDQAPAYQERLDFELGVIESMGFPGYFLIVADFIQWAKAQDIPVGPGRGSGAGSVVAWALTITDLDPIRFTLLFERFLNPERVSMPDFDIDFCQDRRDEVIAYVQDKYGDDRVAQIITFGKLQARAVLRDVGRVLQMPYGQVDRLCKLVPNNPANPVTLAEAIQAEPELRRARDEDDTVRQMIDTALKLEGLYRNASTHAAGVVIGDRPLHELVPLYRDPRSPMPATQFNMKAVEPAGMVKFDFLGLKTLTVLAQAVQFLKAAGTDLDLSTIPLDDAATFAMLGRAEATGVFQLESAGMRDVLRSLKPDCFEDIIAVVALYRPGPMENIPTYINRKHGRETVSYLHPMLEPILRETNGIMIYQEQVMQVAQVLAGYSLGAADLLRRAMGKKIQAEMDQQRQIFMDGAAQNGVERATASDIFDQVSKFAGYGFNKSHAAAYALVAYQTAYLKANHPVAFMAASMCLDMHNTDKLGVFKGELERMSIPLLPPDVNASGAAFTVEGQAVRYGLAALKNVGEAAMQGLVAERERNGPFKDVGDFARRLDPHQVNRRTLETLIRAGALDGLESNRAMLMAGLDVLMGEAARTAEDRASGQDSLFGGAAEESMALSLPSVLDWTPTERLGHERDAVGFYLTSHPLEAYAGGLERLKVVPAANVAAYVRSSGTSEILMAGIIASRKERTNRTGNRYAFVTLSDATATYEVTCFSETLPMIRDLAEAAAPVLLTVDVGRRDEDVQLTVKSVRKLEDVLAHTVAGLKVVLANPDPMPRLAALLGQAKRGQGRLVLVARTTAEDITVDLPHGVVLNATLMEQLRAVPGLVEVAEL